MIDLGKQHNLILQNGAIFTYELNWIVDYGCSPEFAEKLMNKLTNDKATYAEYATDHGEVETWILDQIELADSKDKRLVMRTKKGKMN